MLGSGKDIRIAAKVTAVGNFPDMWVDYGGKFDAYCEVPTYEMQMTRFGKPLAPGDLVQVKFMNYSEFFEESAYESLIFIECYDRSETGRSVTKLILLVYEPTHLVFTRSLLQEPLFKDRHVQRNIHTLKINSFY